MKNCLPGLGVKKRHAIVGVVYVIGLGLLSGAAAAAIGFSSSTWPWWKVVLLIGAAAAAFDGICCNQYTVAAMRELPPA